MKRSGAQSISIQYVHRWWRRGERKKKKGQVLDSYLECNRDGRRRYLNGRRRQFQRHLFPSRHFHHVPRTKRKEGCGGVVNTAVCLLPSSSSTSLLVVLRCSSSRWQSIKFNHWLPHFFSSSYFLIRRRWKSEQYPCFFSLFSHLWGQESPRA